MIEDQRVFLLIAHVAWDLIHFGVVNTLPLVYVIALEEPHPIYRVLPRILIKNKFRHVPAPRQDVPVQARSLVIRNAISQTVAQKPSIFHLLLLVHDLHVHAHENVIVHALLGPVAPVLGVDGFLNHLHVIEAVSLIFDVVNSSHFLEVFNDSFEQVRFFIDVLIHYIEQHFNVVGNQYVVVDAQVV